jgi:2-amino-4-hydroxy-6-hydroxymethyldihydropteridine diphosphokinase
MRFKIDSKNFLYFQRFYPYRVSPRCSKKPYSAVLGIGGNIGDVRRRFNHLFFYLQKSKYIDIIETAPILKNPPFGYLDQADFYNSTIFVKTCLKPKALLRYTLKVEKVFRRKRSFQDAPRTLDIDILFYENIILNLKNLTIPHKEWKNRDSVIIPLSLMESSYIRSILKTKKGS